METDLHGSTPREERRKRVHCKKLMYIYRLFYTVQGQIDPLYTAHSDTFFCIVDFLLSEIIQWAELYIDIWGTVQVPALAQEREDISAFHDLKKNPSSCFFRLKSTAIFMKTLTFWVQN